MKDSDLINLTKAMASVEELLSIRLDIDLVSLERRLLENAEVTTSELRYFLRAIPPVQGDRQIVRYVACIQTCVDGINESTRRHNSDLRLEWMDLARETHRTLWPDIPIAYCAHTGPSEYRAKLSSIRSQRKYLELAGPNGLEYDNVKLWASSTELWLIAFDNQQANGICNKCTSIYGAPNPFAADQLPIWLDIKNRLRKRIKPRAHTCLERL